MASDPFRAAAPGPWVARGARLVRRAFSDPARAAALTIAMGLVAGEALRAGGSRGATAAGFARPAPFSDATATPAGAGNEAAGAAAPSPASAAPPAPAMGRNLFLVRLDDFPRDVGTAQQPLRAEEIPRFDARAKSGAARADHLGEPPDVPEGLRLQASQIRLQSTMMGTPPRALINGELVKEGDVVASFRVLKIEARRVILEREGIRLEVPLQ